MILILISSMFLLLFSIVLHELGHLMALRKYSPKAKIRFYYDSWRRFGIKTGETKDYVFLTKKQKRGVGVMGIIVGLFPILLAGNFNEFYFLLLAPYILGCLHDIDIIIEELKQ